MKTKSTLFSKKINIFHLIMNVQNINKFIKNYKINYYTDRATNKT